VKLFLQHCRAERTGLLIWAGISSLLAFALSQAASGVVGTNSLAGMLKGLPQSLQVAFGNIAGLSPLDSYIAIKVGPSVTLLLTIYAVLLALSAVTREVDRRTIDFLLALPVSRRHVLMARASVLVVYTGLVGLLTWAILCTGLTTAGLPSLWVPYGLLILGQWLLAVTVGALVLLVSLWVDDYAIGVKMAMGAVSLGYILEVTLRISGMSRWARAWSPFSYADAAEILRRGTLPWADVSILVVVAAVAIGASLAVFERKQISL